MAKDRSISRADQDAFAASSYQKAVRAQQSGKFDEEITPIEVRYTDPKTDQETTITVAKDDGIRDGITAESLAHSRSARAVNTRQIRRQRRRRRETTSEGYWAVEGDPGCPEQGGHLDAGCRYL